VLNGAIFALFGLHDVATALDDDTARGDLLEGLEMLEEALPRWDTGWWSLYDLHPHPVPNVASSAYHALHISQLRALLAIAPRPMFKRTLDRFERYSHSRLNRARVLAAKAVFRFLVPRSRTYATLAPWCRTPLRESASS
jgi:hypothetical protein